MKRFFLASIMLLASSAFVSAAKPRTVNIKIVSTTDIHGCFFPWDFVNQRPLDGSLARVSYYANELRKKTDTEVVLLDNGDVLQGQPICYYYDYLHPEKENIAAKCFNYMKYDAITWGNHDIETGHAVYDKYLKEVECPALGANIIRTADNTPYLQPYVIVERQGVRIAVLGLMTSTISSWLSEDKWHGMDFLPTKESARKWVEYIQKHEKPDVIVGQFHSGLKGGIKGIDRIENEALAIAREVSGFDVVLFGHDHSAFSSVEKNADGRNVVMVNSGRQAQNIGVTSITITKKGKRVVSKDIKGAVMDIRKAPVDEAFMAHFKADIDEVKAWAQRKVGTCENTISSADSFFGSSAFTDLIHNLQLQHTGADISLAAPLMFNTALRKGDITVADLFKLYKYENHIYTMLLTGSEIVGHLEMAYDLWVNTMTTPNDHIMKLSSSDSDERESFLNPFFNFDSAAGIDYEVDVTKPKGQRVRVLQMSDGTPFDMNRRYKVAVNSYRGNGGGELLTRGAGIPEDSLVSRIIYRSERDQRYYLMQEIERLGVIAPRALQNWRFVPDEWTVPAIRRDRALLFPSRKR